MGKKKTLKGWAKSGLNMDEYLGLEPCEIDEPLFLDILETVPPEFAHDTKYGYAGQGGEPSSEIDGIYYHMSVRSIGDKCYYLGILPSFNSNNDDE